MKHKCNKDLNGSWAKCCVCDGRLHQLDCTSKRDHKKDCCKKRHEILFSLNITKGIADCSLPMLDEKNKTWME